MGTKLDIKHGKKVTYKNDCTFLWKCYLLVEDTSGNHNGNFHGIDLFRVTRTSLIALINEVSSGTTPLMHGIHLVGFLTLCSICSLAWPLL